MFERFTERARRVIVLAQEESERLRHGYVGTEHLLLGLIREGEGVAARALHACGVTLEEARERVESIVGYGVEGPSQKPFTPRAKRVLEFALREAQDLRHDYMGTEHLLLGLLTEGRGIAAAALSDLDADPEGIRREVLGRLGDSTRPRSQEDFGPLGWAREALLEAFGRRPRPEDRLPFERFTEGARRAVVVARDEAWRLDHNYIGTEHLLLGLIQNKDGIAGRALGELGLDLDGVREQVEIFVGYGEEGTERRAPFSPRSKKVLELALREALQLGHNYVGTEHILLALGNEVEGVAARVFTNLEANGDEIRREVVRRLPGEETAHGVPEDTAPPIEEEGAPRLLFRGRIGGVRAELALPRPVAVTVEADYSYVAPAGPTAGGDTVAPGDVADRIRAGLEEAHAPALETVVAALGESLLDAFPAMLEVGVTVSGRPEPSDPSAPTFSVSSTFRR